jgi:hypothetical protein
MATPFDYQRISEHYRRPLAAGVIAVTTLLAATSISTAQSGPFANLGGAWTGTGQLAFQDGHTERVRCRAEYTVGASGNEIEQSLRCASDSYNFELRSSAQSRGGRISGTWSETTRNINGSLSGQATNGRIAVRAEAGPVVVGLTLVSSGNQQSVTIEPQGQGEISGAAIKLTRRGMATRE